jgi:hypothetical protein
MQALNRSVKLEGAVQVFITLKAALKFVGICLHIAILSKRLDPSICTFKHLKRQAISMMLLRAHWKMLDA